MTQQDRLEESIARALRSAPGPRPLRLVEVTVTPAGKRRVVRVSVDADVDSLDPQDTSSTIAPLTLDEVADATRAISDALDNDDVMGEQPYVLEVSSPGVDRPLRDRRSLRRNVGRLVVVTRHTPGEADHPSESSTTSEGRILSVSEDSLVLATGDARDTRDTGDIAPSSTTTIPLGEIVRAMVQVEFTRADEGDTDGH